MRKLLIRDSNVGTIMTVAAFLLMGAIINTACAGSSWDDIRREAGRVVNGQRPLTNSEVIAGLKEALEIGATNSAKQAARRNGYYSNSHIRIPFPPEFNYVRTTMERIGMSSQLQTFVKKMNRAAEEAAKKAAPIFIDAVKEMTIKDGFDILNGPDNAATKYLQRKTHDKLFYEFKPVVKAAMDKVGLAKVWTPMVTVYNQLPENDPVDPDLNAYITKKGIDGLFYLIAGEEKKIRDDPAARVTELLRRVFGRQ